VDNVGENESQISKGVYWRARIKISGRIIDSFRSSHLSSLVATIGSSRNISQDTEAGRYSGLTR
jgi:hypothetical protein